MGLVHVLEQDALAKREERFTQGIERIADALEAYINERIESDKVLIGILSDMDLSNQKKEVQQIKKTLKAASDQINDICQVTHTLEKTVAELGYSRLFSLTRKFEELEGRIFKMELEHA